MANAGKPIGPERMKLYSEVSEKQRDLYKQVGQLRSQGCRASHQVQLMLKAQELQRFKGVVGDHKTIDKIETLQAEFQKIVARHEPSNTLSGRVSSLPGNASRADLPVIFKETVGVALPKQGTSEPVVSLPIATASEPPEEPTPLAPAALKDEQNISLIARLFNWIIALFCGLFGKNN